MWMPKKDRPSSSRTACWIRIADAPGRQQGVEHAAIEAPNDDPLDHEADAAP